MLNYPNQYDYRDFLIAMFALLFSVWNGSTGRNQSRQGQGGGASHL
jgi:hypothetical protein